MQNSSIYSLSFVALAALSIGNGCATHGVNVPPGHAALYYDPEGGVRHEVLREGFHATPCPFYKADVRCPSLVDFDVTYSTAIKTLNVLSAERLPVQLELTVKYRPIVSELYLLETEIG